MPSRATAMPLSPVGNTTSRLPIQSDTVTPTNSSSFTGPPQALRRVTSQGSFVSFLPVAPGRPQAARFTTVLPPPAFAGNSGKSDVDVSGSPLARCEKRKRRLFEQEVRRVEPIGNALLAAAPHSATSSLKEPGETGGEHEREKTGYPRIDAAIDGILSSLQDLSIEPDDGDARVRLYSGRANVLLGRVGALQSILSTDDGVRGSEAGRLGNMFWARDMLLRAWNVRKTVLGMPPLKKPGDDVWWPKEVPYLLIRPMCFSSEPWMGSVLKEDLRKLLGAERPDRVVQMVLTRWEPKASHRRMSLRVAMESSGWSPDGKTSRARSVGVWWLSMVDVADSVEDGEMVAGAFDAFKC